jgi:hypothetical protein
MIKVRIYYYIFMFKTSNLLPPIDLHANAYTRIFSKQCELWDVQDCIKTAI